MATRKVFTDKDGRELSVRINTEGKLSIEIFSPISDDTIKIALDRIDALGFISELRKIGKELQLYYPQNSCK